MPIIFSNKGTPILIDEEDWRQCLIHNWAESPEHGGHVYFTAFIQGEGYVALHRWVAGALKGQVVDHRSGETRDNRRHNLRVTTQRRNMQNARVKSNNLTGLKGVQRKPSGRFSARIRDDQGERHYLGTFDTADQAHAAYVVAARRYHGEFARAA